MAKNIFKLIIIFIIGMIGGIFANQIFWPYFIERPFFYQYRLEQPPIYLTEKKETIIQENTALQNAVEKIEKSVVGVRTELRTGKVLTGSGIIVTSDGLIVLLAELVPQNASFVFYVDGVTPEYQILKRDLKENLALVKIKGERLSAVGFADFSRLRLGERVFLFGKIPPLAKAGESPLKAVNVGIIKFFSADYIQTNISEKNNLQGSPLFNIEGNLLGLNTIDAEGKVFAIPITKIREFLGF